MVYIMTRGNPAGVGTPLSDFVEGTILNINEGGNPVPFFLAKQDYESGLNGSGRVLMVRQEVYGSAMVWNTTAVNNWESSSLRSWLNGTYKNLLDQNIQNEIGSTAYDAYSNRVITLSDPVFCLSPTEMGDNGIGYPALGEVLPIASLLKIATLNGAAIQQWTRGVPYGNSTHAMYKNQDGNTFTAYVTYVYCPRPVFTLPSDILVSDDLLIA